MLMKVRKAFETGGPLPDKEPAVGLAVPALKAHFTRFYYRTTKDGVFYEFTPSECQTAARLLDIYWSGPGGSTLHVSPPPSVEAEELEAERLEARGDISPQTIAVKKKVLADLKSKLPRAARPKRQKTT